MFRESTSPVLSVPGLKVLLLLGFALLLASRIPAVFLDGRLWAEEGVVFLVNAFRGPWWAALTAPHTGYVNLVANGSTLLAWHLVPLGEVPWVTAGIALVVQCLPALLLATSGFAWVRRPAALALALLLMALVPMSEEVWLNSITSQFHLMLSLALVLAIPPRPGASTWLRGLVLVLAPLSAPGAVFLVPLFWLRAAWDRSAARLRQAVLLTLCAAVQTTVVLLHPEPGRALRLDPALLLSVIYLKQMVLPLLGPQMARAQSEAVGMALAAGHLPWRALLGVPLLFLAGFATAAALRLREAAWMLLAAGAMAIGGYAAAFGEVAQVLGIDFGMRYAYAPSVLLALAVLAITLRGPLALRLAGGALVACLLTVGVRNYWMVSPMMATGPAWRDQAVAWQKDPNAILTVWPDHFRFRLQRLP
jgi:hypothetical protein